MGFFILKQFVTLIEKTDKSSEESKLSKLKDSKGNKRHPLQMH
jgi:hypothetical protein